MGWRGKRAGVQCARARRPSPPTPRCPPLRASSVPPPVELGSLARSPIPAPPRTAAGNDLPEQRRRLVGLHVRQLRRAVKHVLQRLCHVSAVRVCIRGESNGGKNGPCDARGSGRAPRGDGAPGRPAVGMRGWGRAAAEAGWRRGAGGWVCCNRHTLLLRVSQFGGASGSGSQMDTDTFTHTTASVCMNDDTARPSSSINVLSAPPAPRQPCEP